MGIGKKIKKIIADFEAISLDKMDQVRLMRRTDTKFVFSMNNLPDLLKKALPDYYMVEIENEREQIYTTTYFDTPAYDMYNIHHNGKLNRHKVRIRRYVYSNMEFLEVKRKNNKGETIKKRIPHDEQLPVLLPETADKFLQRNTPYPADLLEPTLGNHFIRLTLVNKDFSERITLDYKIKFTDLKHQLKTKTKGICIAEVKRGRDNNRSPFLQHLRNLHINSMGFSKYCIGMALLNPEIRNNLFKEKIRSIVKI